MTDEEKQQYVNQFFDNLNDMIVKKRLSKKAYRTRYTAKDIITASSRFGRRKLYSLKNGSAMITFAVDVRPWRWENGSLFVEFSFVDSNNLLIPKRKIPRSKGSVWPSNKLSDPFFFLDKTGIVSSFIDIVELTKLDVSLFDTIDVLIKDVFYGR